MKPVSINASPGGATFSLLYLFLTLYMVEPVFSQGSKRKGGGFGGIFKTRTDNNVPLNATQPGTPANADAPGAVIAMNRKDMAIRNIVLQVLPADRHYREILADAVVFAYQQTKYKSIWNYRALPGNLGRKLAEQLNRHGIPHEMALDPAAISMAFRRAPVNSRDLGCTIAIANAGTIVRLGPVSAESIWPDWNSGDRPGTDRNDPRAIAMDLLRIRSFGTFDPEIAVDSMAPKNWIYRELQNSYITAKTGPTQTRALPAVPDPESGGLARPGQPYAHAAALAELLAVRGFLSSPRASWAGLTEITPEVAEALKGFQRAYGLSPDGVMGTNTWSHLTTEPKITLRSRAINLHRARLLPDEFGDRYLIINIPAAELYAFEGTSHSMTMRIVHGKNSNEDFHTPIFRDIMREVVFAPYWNVPESIAVNEIYPKLLEDPTYLERHSYEIVDSFNDNATVYELNEETMPKLAASQLWLRQKPTGLNALGQVKFLLPNRHNVYLHDTPSKQYFTMADRAQSHGCIRLAQPTRMAEWVLNKQGWTSEQVAAAFNADAQYRQAISNPVNVFVTYFTSFPRPTGTSAGKVVLSPARDVYKLDEKDSLTLAAVLPDEE